MLCVLSKCYTICIRARSFVRSLPDMAIRLFRRSHARSFARSFVHSFIRLFDQLLLLTPQLICSSNAPFSGKSPLFPCLLAFSSNTQAYIGQPSQAMLCQSACSLRPIETYVTCASNSHR